ncbi:MAG: LPXTG cell wall anchor domain-containing protein, partial [Thomasclavelia sp.]|uniref:LPXTG cell wall anchor domain-containing protein n=1 Tax=Thomasclavelia sp. TaxID=3025757 RepID=UPI0039A1FFDF
AILNDPNATAEEVENAIKGLTKAMAGLEANPADPESTVKPGDATVSVKTGDNSLVEIFAGLSMLSLAGLCLLRKKED